MTRLLDRGDLPWHKLGADRRVSAEDLAAYRYRRDQIRRQALDVLAADAQEAGDYDRLMTSGRAEAKAAG